MMMMTTTTRGREGEWNRKRKPNAGFAGRYQCLPPTSSKSLSDSDMMTIGGEGGGLGKGKRIKRCSSSTADLPMHIIENGILPRLPVKALLRCKSVCKLWYSIIKSPNFVSTHYNHRHRRSFFLETFYNLYRQKVPIAFNPSVTVKREYSVWPIMDNHDDSNLLFSYYLGLPSQAIFLRPVNGLLLMLIPNTSLVDCRMAMLNPATRQFLKLFKFKFIPFGWYFPVEEYLPRGKYLPTNAGQIFGFGTCKKKYFTITTSTSTNPQPQPDRHVYKVVWLHASPTSPDSTHDVAAVAKVYTVGGHQCWRTISSSLPYSFVDNYSNNASLNVCMNGKCYWLSRDLRHILVFDMDEEVFQEMDSPVPSAYHTPLDDFYSYTKMAFHVAFTEMRCCGGEDKGEGDSLALFIFEPEFVDISVMDKEEGWHWTRQIVTYIDRPINDLLNPLLQLQFPTTEAILLKAGRSSFALYNPKTNECVRFCESSSEYDTHTYEQVQVFNFRESLFSMDGGVQLSDCMLEDFSNFVDKSGMMPSFMYA